MITLIRNLLRNLRERHAAFMPEDITEAQRRQRELHYRLVRLEMETRLQARKAKAHG